MAVYEDILLAIRENFARGDEVRISAVSQLVPAYTADEVKATLDAALANGDLELAGHFDVYDDAGELVGDSLPVYKLPT